MECYIRQWTLEDADLLPHIFSNKKILDNLRDGIPYPYTKKDAEEYITAMLLVKQDEVFAYAIVVDEQVIGSLSITRCSNIHYQTAELGYCMAEEYWGKGLMTMAVKQACKIIFQNTDIIRIFAEPFAYNQASCRVLEKAGFQCEGVLRKNAIKNGKVLDMKMYAFIKENECI